MMFDRATAALLLLVGIHGACSLQSNLIAVRSSSVARIGPITAMDEEALNEARLLKMKELTAKVEAMQSKLVRRRISISPSFDLALRLCLSPLTSV